MGYWQEREEARLKAEAHRKAEQKAKKKEADQIEAAAHGITLSELYFRRRCASADARNEATKKRLSAELSRSMKICDAMRKTVDELEKAIDKLENADLNDLQVRYDMKLEEKMDEVRRYSALASMLKSDRKNRG